jgi:hypothetical protein
MSNYIITDGLGGELLITEGWGGFNGYVPVPPSPLENTLSVVDRYGEFEILGQTGNTFLINTGIGYDGYGNRLISTDREWLTLEFPTGTDPFTGYGFLCVRRNPVIQRVAYTNHPSHCLPMLTNYVVKSEFYISDSAVQTYIQNSLGANVAYYYPPVDAYGVIPGLVLGKVYMNATSAPDMTIKSPFAAVKNGTYQPLAGFNVG